MAKTDNNSVTAIEKHFSKQIIENSHQREVKFPKVSLFSWWVLILHGARTAFYFSELLYCFWPTDVTLSPPLGKMKAVLLFTLMFAVVLVYGYNQRPCQRNRNNCAYRNFKRSFVINGCFNRRSRCQWRRWAKSLNKWLPCEFAIK